MATFPHFRTMRSGGAETSVTDTLYDAVHAKGLTAGSVIWPCCNGARTLSWAIP